MELRLPAPCLVVHIGPSGSGKSTWAARTFHDTEIVGSDRLRGMVGAGEDDQQAGTAAFALLEQIVAERMTRKLTTVIDTLGFDQESRRRWVGLAHRAGLPVFAVLFTTPDDETRRRNSERPRPVPRPSSSDNSADSGPSGRRSARMGSTRSRVNNHLHWSRPTSPPPGAGRSRSPGPNRAGTASVWWSIASTGKPTGAGWRHGSPRWHKEPKEPVFAISG